MKFAILIIFALLIGSAGAIRLNQVTPSDYDVLNHTIENITIDNATLTNATIVGLETVTDSDQINWTPGIGAKLTNVTNGTAAQDAVTHSQLYNRSTNPRSIRSVGIHDPSADFNTDDYANDTTAILAAFSSLRNLPGEVVLGTGTFDMRYTQKSYHDTRGPIHISINLLSGQSLRGSGSGATVLKAHAAENFSMINISGNSLSISDLTIDANGAAQTDSSVDGDLCGIIGVGRSYITLRSVSVINSKREGFYLTNSGWINVDHCTAISCNRSGFECDALGYTNIVAFNAISCLDKGLRIVGGNTVGVVAPVSVIGGFFYGNQWGIETINARGVSITGSTCRGNSKDGILVYYINSGQYSDMVSIAGVSSFENNRHGIYLINARNCSISDSKCWNNNYALSENAAGIKLYQSSGCSLTANQCHDTRNSATWSQHYGILESNADGGSDYNIFLGNNCRGNAVDGYAPSGVHSIGLSSNLE